MIRPTSNALVAYRPALALQLLHVALCVVWNGVGLWQVSRGVPTIGPTASWGAIGIVILLGAGFFGLLRADKPVLYLTLSVVDLLLAAAAIHGGFTKDHSLWPSEFWRWAGIVVNSVGVIGFLLALTTYARRKSTTN